jgi:hypothetical protein
MVALCHSTLGLATSSALFGADQDEKYYLPDLVALCGFLTSARAKGNWVLGVESAT